MIHILISPVLKRLMEISDRYCVILVKSYYCPFGGHGSALRPSGITVGDRVGEACYGNFTTSIYVSLNSFIMYSPGEQWVGDMRSINNKGADFDSLTNVYVL